MLPQNSKLQNLGKFKFQKKRLEGNTLGSENSERMETSVLHSLSDSEQESFSESGTAHTVNEKSSNGNCNNDVHVISDSDGETPQPSNSVKSSDSEQEEKSQGEAPKVYSRIKTLSSFGFRKKNGEGSLKRKKIEDTRSKDTIATNQNGRATKRIKIQKKDSDDDDDDNERGAYKSELVYDSDEDSDTEISNKMTDAQANVFEFLNTATTVELLQIATCTQNKVNAIMEARPFENWKDMVYKFKYGKNLGTQLLNGSLDVLKTRKIVSKLMKKCLKIAIKTEECIAAGATHIKEQPSILTPQLELKSYQMVGLNWLAMMHSQNLSGILADEMGLGKTIQVIAFLAHLKQLNLVHTPHLIIAPSTTLENWAIEFTRWCPDLRVVIYHGSPDERRALRVLWFKQKFKEMDVIITTYNIVCSNYEDKKMFKIVPLHYVVFDEAHMLKNMNTQRYFNLFNINAERRILLTGTPLQNNLLELMSLLNFVMPGIFSEKINDIKSFFSKNGKLPVENLPTFEQEQVDLAKRIMKPFVLRRLKEDVLKDLPVKTSEVVICPLDQEQKNKYTSLMEEFKNLAEDNKEGYNYMTAFMKLRKMANHPLALRYLYQDEQLREIAKRLARDISYKTNNEDHVLEDLSFMSDHEIHQLTENYKCISKFHLESSVFLASGKFQKLDELLTNLKSEGHRVIIFSQFVFMLDLLEEFLTIREHTYLRLDGSTRSLDRQELIDNYNEDSSIFVFLLTTRAGGVGINLTTADTVIIHDVDFNPYNDKQAEDRCHRLGQTKPVRVLRLISEGTVEEAIYAKAQSKLNLEQELTGTSDPDESEESKNIEVLLKEVLGLGH